MMAEAKSQPRKPELAGPGPVPVSRELIVPNPKLKLMEQVREVMRLRHYSIRTETCYCDWIRRFIKFHGMRSREELVPGHGKVEMFLSDLAVNGNVAASTQNQAFNALLFLYREILHQPFENVEAVRADRPVRMPVVLTVEEAKQVITALSGVPQLVVKLLYGSGLRLLEALRLRVQDVDFGMKQITVRDGKGAKDRFTVLAESAIAPLQEHLERVRLTHQEDIRIGGGSVLTASRQFRIIETQKQIPISSSWDPGRRSCLACPGLFSFAPPGLSRWRRRRERQGFGIRKNRQADFENKYGELLRNEGSSLPVGA